MAVIFVGVFCYFSLLFVLTLLWLGSVGCVYDIGSGDAGEGFGSVGADVLFFPMILIVLWW